MSDDYLWNKSGEPDPEVERLERLLAPHAHDAPLARAQVERRPPPRRRWWATGMLAAAAAAMAVWFGVDSTQRPAPSAALVTSAPLAPTVASAPPPPAPPGCRDGATGFPFKSSGGLASCGGGAVEAGRLPIGVWLETPAGVRTEVEVADIGALKMTPGSKLRLTKTGEEEHRLELVRGKISAKVDAPPRLFVIDTPAATAVDLGCEYELWVDDAQRSHLAVAAGAVSWEGKGRFVFVPAGAEAVAEPLAGPGTPVAHDASDELRRIVARADAGELAAIDRALEIADADDAISLYTWLVDPWPKLTEKARHDLRSRVAKRMSALGLVPRGVSTAKLADGDEASATVLLETLMIRWFGE